MIQMFEYGKREPGTDRHFVATRCNITTQKGPKCVQVHKPKNFE